MKRCYARYFWRHKWDYILGSVRQVIQGCLWWERRCARCGLHQEISSTLGIRFLEKETGGK